MSTLINLSGLWTPQNKDSKVVMSGSNGQVRYLIFKNDRWEEGGKMPKYNLCIAQVERDNERTTRIETGDDDAPF